MSFDCVKCGACCRVIGHSDELKHFDRGDGACIHLTDQNLCAIYETRPQICRVEENRPEVISRDAWYRMNEEACGRLHLAIYGGR